MQLSKEGVARLILKIEGVVSAGMELKDWDQRFLADILVKLKQGVATLSEKQYAQVERILLEEPERIVRDDPPPNSFPYESEGGTSYYQKRGNDTKRHKRK